MRQTQPDDFAKPEAINDVNLKVFAPDPLIPIRYGEDESCFTQPVYSETQFWSQDSSP